MDSVSTFTFCKASPISPQPCLSNGIPSSPSTKETTRNLQNISQSDPELFRFLWGKANEFKEGDQAISLASTSTKERNLARESIAEIKLKDISSQLFCRDEVSQMLEDTLDSAVADRIGDWSFAQLKHFLLISTESAIKEVTPGLRSEVIAGVCKLMTNDELIQVASKIYNNLPGTTLGARGYFSSRIQPNSPTDDPEEVLFSVLEGLSYGCGDTIFGINIVASDFENVKRLEETLKDVVETFQLSRTTKWCVLAHIDDQMKVEDLHPGLIDCVFQSIGGNEAVNKVFNVSGQKLLRYVQRVHAQYFETGQGSAVTNRADCGIDMNTLESRAHGLARALQKKTGNWMIVNTVAGFIGPEVFRTRDQLLRACLEDLFMGKLHGIVFGLDICSTYHMSLELDDMEYVMDRVMEAGPAFYMAVAGRNDPMLSYLTTGFRDHPRLRTKHQKKVTEELKHFLVSCGIMDEIGKMTTKAGDTEYMYVLYKKLKGDKRDDVSLRQEARQILERLQQRGLDLGYGHDGCKVKSIFDRV
jgi:ethanolamine ammonia-lyase large subunit